MKNLLRTSSIMVLALTMAGCATDPPAALELSSLNLPSMFTAPVAKEAPIWPKADWWKGFGSTEMDGLIDTAQKNNLDLDAAIARVRQAEAQTEISGSVLFPDVTVSADATRSGTKVHGIGLDHNSFGVSPAASYELDFWGKNRDQLRAAEESLKSAKFSQEVVGLTVTSGVANTYLDVLALRERVTIANQNIDAADRILAITEAKVTNGVASNLDLAQQQALVAGQKAQVPALVEQAKEAEYALAVLLGRAPEGFHVDGQNLDGILSPQVAPGVPSALLHRRPDVAAAEANLASAHANVDAARAAFFPSISLNAGGTYGTAALGPTGLGYSIGASLLQTIFDGGRLLGQSRLARAQQRELVDTYRTTVLGAFVDVETSLGQVGSLAEQQKLKTDQVNAATEAFRISEIQYREGVADLLTVLQAQQTLFTAQDQLVQIKLARIQADIGLYKALGGSWTENPDDVTQPIPASTAAPAKDAPAPQKS
ncbi:MAG: efflux transporter outer membrane subunit [Pseudomonadota bacterium]|nr:efflux transporter outer membrane subunit [Pseudomonadota bacterium]